MRAKNDRSFGTTGASIVGGRPGGRTVVFRLLMVGIVVVAAVFVYGGYAMLFPVKMQRAKDVALSDLPTDIELNTMAWEASYTERGLPIPVDGPREGYWGTRLGAADWVAHPELGHHTGEAHIPGKWDSDANGVQRVGAPCEPSVKIVIHGGSVSEGAYASSIATTYFARTAALLAELDRCVSIVVAGGSGWTSVNELIAFRVRSIPEDPDIVLFLDGLNDLTDTQSTVPPDGRADTYLKRMRQAREEVLVAGMQIVFALQPDIHHKRTKTPIEQWILQLTGMQELIARDYPRMAAGLQVIADERAAAHFIDCSRVFDDEPYTTVADVWHFSDPGHELLARKLADGLAPIVAALQSGEPDEGDRAGVQ